MIKKEFVCPDCGFKIDGFIEFFEKGYKNCFICSNCGNGDKKYWFNSYGMETEPHLTWKSRHDKKKMIKEMLEHRTYGNSTKKSLENELKNLGGIYD